MVLGDDTSLQLVSLLKLLLNLNLLSAAWPVRKAEELEETEEGS